jgi:hypothetical protein
LINSSFAFLLLKNIPTYHTTRGTGPKEGDLWLMQCKKDPDLDQDQSKYWIDLIKI